MKDRYSLFRIKKDRIGKADMQGSDKKPSGKTDMQEPGKKLSDKADIPGSGKKLSDKTDIQGRGKKQSGKADVHERRESGGKLTGKSAPKSAKATRDQTGLRKLLNDRRLAVSCFALCAAALCILCISVVKTLSSRDDSVHVLPVTLAGALTENNEDEEFAEEQAGDENVRIRRKTKMLLNALVNDLQTAETFTSKTPPQASTCTLTATPSRPPWPLVTWSKPTVRELYLTVLSSSPASTATMRISSASCPAATHCLWPKRPSPRFLPTMDKATCSSPPASRSRGLSSAPSTPVTTPRSIKVRAR